MHIGTPLSRGATKVMLLGSGELGKEVIISLQRLGVEVIAVDRYANAPGHQVAHRAHVINMADAKALRALVEQEKPDYIIPEIEAIATDELAAIEATGLCTVIPTARATRSTVSVPYSKLAYSRTMSSACTSRFQKRDIQVTLLISSNLPFLGRVLTL